jgi:hypothetical protein
VGCQEKLEVVLNGIPKSVSSFIGSAFQFIPSVEVLK